MSTKRFFGWGAGVSILALPRYASAEMKGPGGMSGAGGEHGGMKMEGHGQSGGHDMMKMGDKAFSGKIGPWQGTARIGDMKAQGAMPNSHHIAFRLTDAAKKPVTEGKGTVTVTGPDKKETRAEFMVMQGHFGADGNLPTPGEYTFKTETESGGQKGGATFSYTLK